MNDDITKIAQQKAHQFRVWTDSHLTQDDEIHLASIIESACEKATEDLQHDCKRLAETLSEITKCGAKGEPWTVEYVAKLFLVESEWKKALKNIADAHNETLK